MGPGPLELFPFVVLVILLAMAAGIVGKKIRAMGPGPLVPFVVLAILMAMAFICVKNISGTTLPRNFEFCTRQV